MADPDRIVARGKIKVDARRAIAKLRDHLLVDLHLYAAEIARVAVALGAPSLEVKWDANDLVLTWAGRPLPASGVARARDHVLTPDDAIADGEALRVLGIGLSAALGLGPSYVDVTCVSEAECARVRFERKHIDEDAGAEAPEPLVVIRPSDMVGPGMRFHVRRRTGLESLGRAVRREAPREVALLLRATRHAPLAIRVNGEAVSRAAGPTVLVQVDLDEPAATRAVLEVLAPAGAGLPHTMFMELGVHLVDSAGIGLREHTEGVLPLRVVIDARRLPTNASRSEVRMDADLVTRIRARVPGALAAALAALEGVAMGTAATAASHGHAVTVASAPRELFEDALGAIASDVAGAVRAGKPVSETEQRLLELPLLVDAVGAPLSLARLHGGTPTNPLLVYTGKTPAPPELAPWLGGIVWHRGRPAERALALLIQASANERGALAHEGFQRRARALEHPASRAVLATSSTYVLKQAFRVTEGPFAGLEGEVAVMRREGGYRRTSTARLLVDDRPLETVQLPGVALPVDMALSWPGGIAAALGYGSVERNDGLSRAIVYALRVAAIAIGERVSASDPELARLAILAFAGATKTLGDASSAREALGDLARQAVWPATDGSLLTLATIEAYAQLTGAICTGPASSRGADDGRPVLVAEHGKVLLQLLGATAVLVDYGPVLARPPSAATEALAVHGAECVLRVPVARKNVVGFVGIGPNRRRILHGGKVLQDEPHSYRNGPVLVVLEDRAAVPTPDHTTILWSPETTTTDREEDALLELAVEACERGDLEYVGVASEYFAAAARKLATRAKLDARREEARWAAALAPRVADLPARIARATKERARAALLARGRVAADATTAAGAPSASLTSAAGVVSVTLVRGGNEEGIEGPVLFDGHLVENTTVLAAAVRVTVNAVSEAMIDDWATLSKEGKAWAHTSAIDAACKLLAQLSRNDGLASDVDALTLATQLAVNEPIRARARVGDVVRATRWPTVQGGTTSLGDDGALAYGTEAYSPYRTSGEPSPYDAAALHVPSTLLGKVRARVLDLAGFELVDVTKPIARLQELRSRGAAAATPPPRLAGAPSHPRLRASLALIGVTLAEGELELLGGDTSEITRVDGRGALQPVPFALDVPARVVFRSVGEAGAEVRAELALAAEHHLRSLGEHLDELPDFVRGRLRALVCSDVESTHRVGAGSELAVFASLDGRFWSLAQLVELGTVRRTYDRALLSTTAAREPVLLVSDGEAKALSAVLTTRDCTEELREARRGDLRRSAAPVEKLVIPDHLRARCIWIFPLDKDGMRGEVGLLHPSHADERGISVHTSRRPVTTIVDGDTWPTVAIIDVEGLATTPGFDALAEAADRPRIQGVIRWAVGVRAAEIMPVPAGALGVLRTPVPFMARPRGGSTALPVPCLGVFWLTPEWPDAPTVHVEARDIVDPFRRPRMAAREGAHHRVLPIAGRVWICAGHAQVEAPLEAVLELVHSRLGPLLGSAANALRRASPAEYSAYEWDLRLLGARGDVDPVEALASDRPDPVLMHVATRRAPHLIDAAIGDAPIPASPAPPPNAEQPATIDTAAPTAEIQAPSFLEGLVRWVVDLVTPAPEQLHESPRTQSLASALASMKLTGDPVARVVESGAKGGRPVRYDAKTKSVLVNATHETMLALEAHPSRDLLLLAAAVSEINRELVPVTDAEEMSVVVDLLRDG